MYYMHHGPLGHTRAHTHKLCTVTYALLLNIHEVCFLEVLRSGLPDSKSSGMCPISAVPFSLGCALSVGTLQRVSSGKSMTVAHEIGEF